MDPDATFKLLLKCLVAHDRDGFVEHAEALLNWVRKGGFLPGSPAKFQHAPRNLDTPSRRIIKHRVEAFSDDFQVLLQDFWWDVLYTTLPARINSYLEPVAQYRQEVLEVQADFELRDWQIVMEMATLLRSKTAGSELPPLLAEGAILRDGYHRVTAFYLTGVEFWQVIDMERHL